MPERHGYIPGVPCWVDASEPDPAAAVEFYSELLSWQCEEVTAPGSGDRYFMARLRPRSIFELGRDVAAIGSMPRSGPPIARWNTYVWVDSADATASKVRDAGGGVVVEPCEFMDASRIAVFTDPEGAAFGVWEAKGHDGARVVNDPGTLNFNGLNTRDAEGAKAFYGAVFGWGTMEMGGVEMWTLDGYADFIERHHPGLREQVAGLGAPDGFMDVVAQLLPIGEDQPDTPPHWSVTFAVDDADAAAAKATELGGQVIVAPFDAPWVRMTVLADPQGATFVGSKFAPENRDLGG